MDSSFDLTKRADKIPKITTPGITEVPSNLNKYKNSSSSLLTTIEDSGSPIGVNTAPKPMSKQAKITKRISDFLSSGNIVIIETRIIAATIAVTILEISPSTITKRPINSRCGIDSLIFNTNLVIGVLNHLNKSPATSTASVILTGSFNASFANSQSST